MYYRICEYCGAHLDPQEICECVRGNPEFEEVSSE